MPTLQPQKVSWRKQLQYKFDNFMAQGGWSIFLVLLLSFVGAIAFMGTIRYLGELLFPNSYHPSAIDLYWQVFVQMIGLDVPSDDSNFPAHAVGVMTLGVGVILFSSLVAFSSQEFDKKVQELSKGKSLVVERNHTLILGFSDRLVDIIRELIIANESELDGAIVILASVEKDQIDDFIKGSITDFKTTRLITRTGAITNISNLDNVSIAAARSIIILNNAKGSDPEDLKSLADSQTIKAILAILATIGEAPVPPIIAELHAAQYRHLAEQIAPEAITTLNEADLLARILVQTSRSIGLAAVYLDLVGFEGHEFYFYSPPDPESLQNLTFGELAFHFNNSVPVGIFRDDRSLELNPPLNTPLQSTDQIILLAEDDSVIRFESQPFVQLPQTTPLYPNATLGHKLEKHLILGWNEKTPTALQEYAKYLTAGSHVGLVVDQINSEIASLCEEIQQTYSQITLQVREANIRKINDLRALEPCQYNSITILAGQGQDAEEIDARTLTSLLELRQILKEHSRSSQQPITTALIAEIVNSEDTDLVIKAGVEDFILSNQLVSKILAQVSQNPDVMLIYKDLFSPHGDELYIKPVSLYLFPEQLPAITFADCVLAAQARHELCLGIKITAESQNKKQNFGIKLAPSLIEPLNLTLKDSLITLAKDET
jgi:hypothetical protein